MTAMQTTQALRLHPIADGVSTLVFRNLPRLLTVDGLLQYLDELVPSAAYDFVLMPVDGQRHLNLCQCIVNFVTSEDAQQVATVLHSRLLTCAGVSKKCKVCIAAVQGLKLNLAVCALNLCFGDTEPEREMQMPLVFDLMRRPVDLGMAMRWACQGAVLHDAWLIHTRKLNDKGQPRHNVCHKDDLQSFRPGGENLGQFALESELVPLRSNSQMRRPTQNNCQVPAPNDQAEPSFPFAFAKNAIGMTRPNFVRHPQLPSTSPWCGSNIFGKMQSLHIGGDFGHSIGCCASRGQAALLTRTF